MESRTTSIPDLGHFSMGLHLALMWRFPCYLLYGQYIQSMGHQQVGCRAVLAYKIKLMQRTAFKFISLHISCTFSLVRNYLMNSVFHLVPSSCSNLWCSIYCSIGLGLLTVAIELNFPVWHLKSYTLQCQMQTHSQRSYWLCQQHPIPSLL